MYIPEYFNQPDREKAISLIKANSFGQLISQVDGRLFATHLPFMVSDDGTTLLCHLARENPQWEKTENQEVLLTFQGPHDYISPGWYTHRGVPTWNYQVVHVYGTCRCIHSPDDLRAIVDRLTQIHENRQEEPWEPVYSDNMLRGIVGIEITVTEMQCAFKLNQNRSQQDRDGVISALNEQGTDDMASAMRDNQS